MQDTAPHEERRIRTASATDHRGRALYTEAVPRRRGRSGLVLRLVGFVLAVCSVLALRHAESGERPNAAAPEEEQEAAIREVAPLPVTAVRAERGPFVLTAYGTGRAEAVRRAVLSSPVGERVALVCVASGTTVRRGTLLAALDPERLRLDVAEAEARLQRANIDYERQLFRDDGADSLKRSRVADFTGRTEAALRLERARRDLASAEVRAPFDGVVAKVEAREGEHVPANAPLLTLVSLDRIRIPVEVLENDLPGLRPGAAADLRFAALPGESFAGTIAALAPEIDASSGTGRAFVELDNPGGRIRPGMYAEAVLDAGRFEERVAVPREALLERDRKLVVFRAQGGRAVWTYVTTGLETDTRVEIVSGVAPGDTVLVAGHLTLAHGAPIQVQLLAKGPEQAIPDPPGSAVPEEVP